MTDQPDTDLYAVLGVAPNASHTELDHAFRALARRVHPDLNHDAAAGAAFQHARAAYAVLRDPIARSAYDRRHEAAIEPVHASTTTAQTTSKTAANGRPGSGARSPDAVIAEGDPAGEPALRIGPVHHWIPNPCPQAIADGCMGSTVITAVGPDSPPRCECKPGPTSFTSFEPAPCPASAGARGQHHRGR